ncbi:aminocarboxymuconate-semialdehyde decarboxylase [Rhodotorula toruloides]|uniref:Aminocarboxymuconate-semialdehyde decarboxylase n=1 Tax=Rhodotorula toruloides TaxID=5286 RepID=A0A511KR41_RHOTO|nr:aminocarboxymuconate-semialdehyde decarboxylase [Rhodotorula toruloides]
MYLLRRREQIPKVVKNNEGTERVVLLKEEEGKGANSKGRPVGPHYYEREEKIKFMDAHGIDVSVVSLANPWLDFLAPSEAVLAAREINADLQSYCSTYSPPSSSYPNSFTPQTQKRLFAFGSLPLVPGIETDQVLEAVGQVKELTYLRGIVMGTKGVGKGLDDPVMEPIYAAIAEAGLVVFVHPHYGIENAFGEQDNGHALALGLGFPFETTIAIARLILAGVLDRHPTLKLLLAHSAGALSALSSRLSSCIIHDPHVKDRLQNDFRYYLDSCELAFVDRVNGRSDFLAPEGSFPGVERIMFGTDHPFFPPLEGSPNPSQQRWKSVDENLDAIAGVAGWGERERRRVMGTSKMTSTPPPHFPPTVQYLTTPSPSRLLPPAHRTTFCSPCPPSLLPNPPPRVAIRKIDDFRHPANGQSGLFNASNKPIPRGTWIRDYLGFVHTEAESDPLSDYDLSLQRTVVEEVDPETGEVVQRVQVVGCDATKMGNEARFVNDYRGVPGFQRPNAVFELREWEMPDSGGQKSVRMAVRAGPHGVEKGAEICVIPAGSQEAGAHCKTLKKASRRSNALVGVLLLPSPSHRAHKGALRTSR